jgi:putative transcriptional regulator
MSGLINQLRALRESNGMTQADLATALGVSRQTIISIEQGRYAPSLDLALRLARLFGRTVEELFQLPD